MSARRARSMAGRRVRLRPRCARADDLADLRPDGLARHGRDVARAGARDGVLRRVRLRRLRRLPGSPRRRRSIELAVPECDRTRACGVARRVARDLRDAQCDERADADAPRGTASRCLGVDPRRAESDASASDVDPATRHALRMVLAARIVDRGSARSPRPGGRSPARRVALYGVGRPPDADAAVEHGDALPRGHPPIADARQRRDAAAEPPADRSGRPRRTDRCLPPTSDAARARLEDARGLAGGAEPERDATGDVPRSGWSRGERLARRRRDGGQHPALDRAVRRRRPRGARGEDRARPSRRHRRHRRDLRRRRHGDGGTGRAQARLGDGGRHRREPQPSVLLQDDGTGGGGSCGAPRVRSLPRQHRARRDRSAKRPSRTRGTSRALATHHDLTPTIRRFVAFGSPGRRLRRAPPDRRANQGEAGTAGTPGRRGPMGATGPQGPAGARSRDGGVAIPVACLSPCHGFNGVVSQFQTSVHYTEYLANVASATPETEWTTPGAAVRQLPRDRRAPAARHRQRRHDATTAASSTSPAASSSTRDPVTGALSTANYTGSATVAEVYCTTCHAVTDANDPHKTGHPLDARLLPASGRRRRRRQRVHREEPRTRPR